VVDDIIRQVIRDGRTNPNIEDIRQEINTQFTQFTIIDSFLNDQVNFDAFAGFNFIINNESERLTPAQFQQRIRNELEPLKRLIPQFDTPTISNQIRQRIELQVRSGNTSSSRGSFDSGRSQNSRNSANARFRSANPDVEEITAFLFP
jgi:hypothetical protein